MIKFIKISDFPKYFTCPFCFTKGKTSLTETTNGVRCKNCQRKFLVKNHILEFIVNKELDNETRRELKGNRISLAKKNIEHYANKDNWSNYYNHFVNKKFGYLIKYLDAVRMQGIVSLGSGPGFELKQLLKRKPIYTIFSSDLAYSTTRVVPVALKDFNIILCLFTSDINNTPVIPNDSFPILIYEALHHTGNIHLSIEKLLQKRFKNIFFVEPSTNFMIKILAKFNLAQRVEYSGVKPDFLDIEKLKRLAKKYNYDLKIRTLWDVPEEYFRVICKKESLLQTILLGIIDLISTVGDKIQFGSFAVVALERGSRHRNL
jgi:DNA-directed RNA polymerase subunit RPC12/RpoP